MITGPSKHNAAPSEGVSVGARFLRQDPWPTYRTQDNLLMHRCPCGVDHPNLGSAARHAYADQYKSALASQLSSLVSQASSEDELSQLLSTALAPAELMNYSEGLGHYLELRSHQCCDKRCCASYGFPGSPLGSLVESASRMGWARIIDLVQVFPFAGWALFAAYIESFSINNLMYETIPLVYINPPQE